MSSNVTKSWILGENSTSLTDVDDTTAVTGATLTGTIPAAGITGTLGSGVTIPAAGVTGTLGSGVTLGSSVTGLPVSKVVQSHAYLVTGPVTVPNGSGSQSDLLTMAFTKEENAATSKLIFFGASRVFNTVGASTSWKGPLYTKVNSTYTAAPVTTSHGAPPAGVIFDIYRLNDGQSSPYRTGHFVTLGPFETTDYGAATYSFVVRHYRDGYDTLKVDWMCVHITEVII